LRPDSVRSYATGRIAILWSDKKSHPVSDLTQNWVRFVALANPRLAPYGAAAQQALEHSGLWPALKGKIVYGENVRQALQLFDSGNADAVLTALSLVVDRKPDLIPADWHSPIVQKAGIVAASANQADADTFLRFLTSPAGQAVFAKFGFGPGSK
jgi:molybdate transport system substrate-binding protein